MAFSNAVKSVKRNIQCKQRIRSLMTNADFYDDSKSESELLFIGDLSTV